MLSLTRKQETFSPAADPDGPVPPAGPADNPDVTAADVPTQIGETRRGHSRRMARRARLHGYALLAVALVAIVIALAASNTARVRVSWLIGSSHVSLIWLILATAIVSWLLGLVTNAALHRRTRAPRPVSRP